MRVTEIIRDILDAIDSIEQGRSIDSTNDDNGYSEKDIKRFRQIVDLAQTDETPYGNQPTERYADVDAVTVDAGSDSWQGTKHPADIRGEHPSLYPGTVHGAR
jgi:hypothetical protein